MASVTVRNLPDEVHRALRVRAAQHGRSTEAEIRDILEIAARPPLRIKLGSLLASIAREAGGLTDEEVEQINQLRDKTPAEPMRFDD
ncbi:MAG: plasmid stabilization protein [Rhodocyclaceae bacterium]|nr:plasmid stabilization protein [Rhodocyclaceae bacterium]